MIALCDGRGGRGVSTPTSRREMTTSGAHGFDPGTPRGRPGTHEGWGEGEGWWRAVGGAPRAQRRPRESRRNDHHERRVPTQVRPSPLVHAHGAGGWHGLRVSSRQGAAGARATAGALALITLNPRQSWGCATLSGHAHR